LLNRIAEDTNKVHTIRLGIGSTNDSLLKENWTGRSFAIRPVSASEILKEYFAERPVDMVKIDLEGAAYLLFAGSNFGRLPDSRHIVIEIYTVQPARSLMSSAIGRLGFELIKQDPDVFLFVKNRPN
jgi:hypothetical protein